MVTSVRVLVPVVVAAATAVMGCGAEVEVSTKPDKLAGTELATRANTQLEKQNPQLTHGTLTCADAKYDVGATSRCLRTVVLADGRLVRIGATVTIDSTKDGGHFQVKVDDEAQDFGITGKAVLDDLTKQYAARYKVAKPDGSCPDFLPGKVGSKITCTLETKEGRLPILVTVTGVDPKTYNTEYTFAAAK
jgi:hypothetical protein